MRISDWSSDVCSSDHASWLRRHPAAAELPGAVPELALLTIAGRGWASKFAYLKIALRMLRKKFGSQLVGMGAALQGRLLKLALDEKLTIISQAPVDEIMVEDGRVVGVVFRHLGRQRTVRRNHGEIGKTPV